MGLKLRRGYICAYHQLLVAAGVVDDGQSFETPSAFMFCLFARRIPVMPWKPPIRKIKYPRHSGKLLASHPCAWIPYSWLEGRELTASAPTFAAFVQSNIMGGNPRTKSVNIRWHSLIFELEGITRQSASKR